ncbi:hypothetical protein DL93DRAFT_2160472 [Clavulina sp. PMI_390]|nr:hypothetical protein DL93DRAFT_2160472 [Clavulina sp. PMI_390]
MQRQGGTSRPAKGKAPPVPPLQTRASSRAAPTGTLPGLTTSRSTSGTHDTPLEVPSARNRQPDDQDPLQAIPPQNNADSESDSEPPARGRRLRSQVHFRTPSPEIPSRAGLVETNVPHTPSSAHGRQSRWADILDNATPKRIFQSPRTPRTPHTLHTSKNAPSRSPSYSPHRSASPSPAPPQSTSRPVSRGCGKGPKPIAASQKGSQASSKASSSNAGPPIFKASTNYSRLI